MFQDELKNMLAKRNKGPSQAKNPAENPPQNNNIAPQQNQNELPLQNVQHPVPKKLVPPPVKDIPVKKEDMGSTISQLENMMGGNEGKKSGPPPVQVEKVVVNKGAPPPPMLNLALPPVNSSAPKPQPKAKPKEETKNEIKPSSSPPKMELKPETKPIAPQPKTEVKSETNHHKIFDPISPPKFETKPLLEIKITVQEPPKQEPPKIEPLKQELPKLEHPKQEPQNLQELQKQEEPMKQDPSKSLEFKDQVKNLRFPSISFDAPVPKKDKKHKIIVCVTHQSGITATQEETVKFFKNANVANCFNNNIIAKEVKHKKEKKAEEKVEKVEKCEEKKQDVPQNIPPPPPNINIKPPPPLGTLGNFSAPKNIPPAQESFDKNKYEAARTELKQRLEQRKAEDRFEECISIKEKIKRIEDLFKNIEQAEGEPKNQLISELNKELQKI